MKGKKRMGRPPIENPRNTLISLKVTARERARLVKAARAAGMSLSAYVMAPHRREEERGAVLKRVRKRSRKRR